MDVDATLKASSQLGPPVRSTRAAGHLGLVHAGTTDVELVSAPQFGKQRQMQTVPYARGLPVAQSPPASHATTKAQFLGEVLTRRAHAQHEQDAI